MDRGGRFVAAVSLVAGSAVSTVFGLKARDQAGFARTQAGIAKGQALLAAQREGEARTQAELAAHRSGSPPASAARDEKRKTAAKAEELPRASKRATASSP